MIPLPGVWMVRLSLIYLLLGTGLGSLLLWNKAFPLSPSIWGLLPLHYSVMVWGYLLPFLMGTAYWIFPKHRSESPRGSVVQAWMMVGAYHSGLMLYCIHLLFGSLTVLHVISKLCFMASILLFIRLLWARTITYRQSKHSG